MGTPRRPGTMTPTQQARALVLTDEIQKELAAIPEHVEAIATHAELLAGCARRLKTLLWASAPYGSPGAPSAP